MRLKLFAFEDIRKIQVCEWFNLRFNHGPPIMMNNLIEIDQEDYPLCDLVITYFPEGERGG